MNTRKIRLRDLLLAGLILAAIASTSTDQTVRAQDFTPRRGEVERFVEYERQLNAILKTRRDEEKLFIAKVVDKVRLNKIPSKLVNTSFDWVRKNRPETNYPFIYFERVLRLQANKLNLSKEIPPFDFSVYRNSVGQSKPTQRGIAGQATRLRQSLLRLTPGSRRQ